MLVPSNPGPPQIMAIKMEGEMEKEVFHSAIYQHQNTATATFSFCFILVCTDDIHSVLQLRVIPSKPSVNSRISSVTQLYSALPRRTLHPSRLVKV